MVDETIQYKRYNACICSYLTSGITGALRYRFEKVENARVFYPYVLDEQFERFTKGQGIVPIERCNDKTSRTYADWDKFLLCFSPVGKVEGVCDHLVYIADGKAGYVPLSGATQLRKPIDTLKNSGFADLQPMLLKDISILSSEYYGYAVYYRTIFEKGSFTIYKHPVPFDVLFPILKSGEFTKEALFLQYTLKVASAFKAEEVNDYLDRNRKRFINVVSRHWKQQGATDILSKEWCFHTRLVFEQYAKQDLSDKQSHLVEMVLGYCNNKLKKTDSASGRGGVPHLSFFKQTIDVKKLYAALIKEGFISEDTGEENFTYYMTGKGDVIPTEKIIWYSSNAKLTYLIYSIEGYGNCEWSTVAKIFRSSQSGEIFADSLRTSFHKSFNHSAKETNKRFFLEFMNRL